MGLVAIALSTVATAVPLYAVTLGADAVTVGLLVALPNVFPVLLALVAGRLVDRMGALRWLLIGSLGMVSAPLLVVAVGGLAPLLVAQLLIGLFHVFVTLAAQDFVAVLGERRSFERDFAWYSTALAAGRLVGPLLAGIVIDVAGFRETFAVVVAGLVGTTLLVALLRRSRPLERLPGELPGAPDTASPTTTSRASATPAPGCTAGLPAPVGPVALLTNVGVQLAVFSSAGVFVAIAVRQAFLPVYLQQLAYSATSIGLMLSLGGLASVLVRPLMPLITRAMGGPARALVLAMAAVALGVGVLGVVDTYAALVALTLLAGVGTGVGLPLSIVTVASHVDRRQRGLALGLRLSLNRAAQLAAPVVIGAVIAASGFAVGFGLAGVMLGLLMLLALTRVRSFEQRARELDAA